MTVAASRATKEACTPTSRQSTSGHAALAACRPGSALRLSAEGETPRLSAEGETPSLCVLWASFADAQGFSEFSESVEGFAEAEGFPQFSQSVEGFVDVQSSEGTETPERPGTSRLAQPQTPFVEMAHVAQPKKDVSRPQNRSETGEAAGFSEFPESGEGFAEVTEPTKSDTQRDRARAREEDGDKEPRHTPMPWLSQRCRGRSILDIEF
jgi:hypothetical protein